MSAPLVQKERDRLLADIDSAYVMYREAGERDDDKAEARHLARAEKLESEYWRRLPRTAMACCPHCGSTFVSPFDPFDLVGLWWRGDEDDTPPPVACPHFVLRRGAVHFHGKPARAGRSVRTGPEVPYLLPRLLTMPGMVAVIGELAMDNGYTAYPILYFTT